MLRKCLSCRAGVNQYALCFVQNKRLLFVCESAQNNGLHVLIISFGLRDTETVHLIMCEGLKIRSVGLMMSLTATDDIVPVALHCCRVCCWVQFGCMSMVVICRI